MDKNRPTIHDLIKAKNKTIPDVIDYHLRVLFCGINPGLYTAWSGHHFGRPGNRFWKALAIGGFTPRVFHPSEQHQLLSLGYGITNMVNRATAAAAEIADEEYENGRIVLEEKIHRYTPAFVAVVGMEAYRKAFGRPKAAVGLQPERVGKTALWVLPNPSGLNAHYTPAQLGALFGELYTAVRST